MLKELRIKNFALIDHLSICFNPGLNILTGETGAGKTILINALNLLLGGRASSEYIRAGGDSAEVEGAFFIEQGHPIFQHLESTGYTCTAAEGIVIRRVIYRSEKANRCYLNEHIVPLSIIDKIGAWLVDIHGQHEHQLLLDPARHIKILDRFSGLEPLIEEVSHAYHAYQGAQRKFEEIVRKNEEAHREQELISFQREEIDRFHLSQGEEGELLKQHHLLAHAVKIQELVFSIEEKLYQSEGAICEALGEITSKIEELAGLDPHFKPVEESVTSIIIQLEDVAHQLREYAKSMDFSPQHLEEIEERLDQISRLKKKYRCTFDEILSFREKIEKQWQALEDYEGLIKQYARETEKSWMYLREKATRLSEERRRYSMRVEKAVEEQLKDLQMKRANFIVQFSNPVMPDNGHPENLTQRGWDEVEFIFSANEGEEPKPLSKIASGGEISRVMLAFKSCLAQADQVLTLVFDEIDTGIGGKTAVTVGQKMKNLAQKCQIICITHMPQIACNAHAHFLVSKKVEKGRTLTVVDQLSREAQIEELAKMIEGDAQSEIGLRHATEMLRRSECLR